MGGSTVSGAKKLLLVLGLFIAVAAIVYAVLHNDQAVNNNPNACVNRTFSIGDSGNCISDGQRLLNWYLYGIDQPNYMAISGTFNSITESAVRKTQSGASLTINGQLNPPTWKLLCQGNDAPNWWVSAAKNAGCPSV